MAWYETAVFYHIYPFGLCGCAHENQGVAEDHFNQLREWTEHASQINCTAIYIGPLFESESHGYDTIDYRKVDVRLGSNQQMREFVDFCHNKGMRVIVDGVFNHVGRQFFAFQDLLKFRENSRYLSWFCDVNFGSNNEYNDGFSYGNWGGHNLLVKLNQRNPEVKQYHFDTIHFWIEEFGIDGIRLDAADVLDMDFMHELRMECDAMKSDFWLMGEVIHGDYSRYANPSMLYSVTNYELHKALYSGHNDHNYYEIAHSVKRLLGICKETLLYTFSDNHDVERLYSKLKVKEHQKLVAMLVYSLPGIPSIYYGSEYGITGVKEKGNDDSLRPFLTLEQFAEDEEGNFLCQLYTRLGELKRAYPALSYGAYEEVLLTNRQFAYVRILDNQAVLTILNNDEKEVKLQVKLPIKAQTAQSLLDEDYITINDSMLSITLEKNSGKMILLKLN